MRREPSQRIGFFTLLLAMAVPVFGVVAWLLAGAALSVFLGWRGSRTAAAAGLAVLLVGVVGGLVGGGITVQVGGATLVGGAPPEWEGLALTAAAVSTWAASALFIAVLEGGRRLATLSAILVGAGYGVFAVGASFGLSPGTVEVVFMTLVGLGGLLLAGLLIRQTWDPRVPTAAGAL